jgi:ribosomal protein S18 acetylase RimI-like enzyme
VIPSQFVIDRLASSHNRSGFTCGSEPLDRYLRQQANQDIKKRAAICFVAAEANSGIVAGYYTLAATTVLLRDLPASVAGRLPRYPAVPCVLLGRLAVAAAFQGRKLGAVLLADAVARVARADIASFALVVDPKDMAAAAFYRRYGFALLPAPEKRMLLPIDDAVRLLGERPV